ncbi:hypothetical protein D1867_08170 [Acidianus infernus]|uniref:Uncharacterized protein n=1 Tax=Acidianus infernus TaxID=12915 RepID=A0A6A9QEF3_ACIIN|nr:hypothetical protein [Acidianus infernus]MCY0873917.1 hypothetical protein [Acidianus infernus]MCY0884190.1 hypothetical protein [Acidianus infernus]MUM65209.1 hypothetical protein [Acidianus infernus]
MEITVFNKDLQKRINDAIYNISALAVSNRSARKDLLRLRKELKILRKIIQKDYISYEDIITIKGEFGVILISLYILSQKYKRIKNQLEHIQDLLLS